MGKQQFHQYIIDNISEDAIKNCWKMDCKTIYSSISNKDLKFIIQYLWYRSLDFIIRYIPKFEITDEFQNIVTAVSMLSMVLFDDMQQTNDELYISPFYLNETVVDHKRYVDPGLKYTRLHDMHYFIRYPISYGIFFIKSDKVLVQSNVLSDTKNGKKIKQDFVNQSNSKNQVKETPTNNTTQKIEQEKTQLFLEMKNTLVPSLVKSITQCVPESSQKNQLKSEMQSTLYNYFTKNMNTQSRMNLLSIISKFSIKNINFTCISRISSKTANLMDKCELKAKKIRRMIYHLKNNQPLDKKPNEPLDKKQNQPIIRQVIQKLANKPTDTTDHINKANQIYDEIVDKLVPKLVKSLMICIPTASKTRKMILKLTSHINSYFLIESFYGDLDKNWFINNVLFKFSDENGTPCIRKISKQSNEAIDQCLIASEKFMEIMEFIQENESVSEIDPMRDSVYDPNNQKSINNILIDFTVTPGWSIKEKGSSNHRVHRKPVVFTKTE